MRLNAKEFGLKERYWRASMGNLTIPEEYHKEISSWIKDPKNMLILTGSPGTGKTHLCAAILNDLWNNKEVRYFRDDDLYLKAKQAMQRNWDGCACILEQCDSRYLIIDDFGVDEITPYKLQTIERLIDYRYSKGNDFATIITTNLSPVEIKQKYSNRIASRIFATENKVIFLEGYDLRQQNK